MERFNFSALDFILNSSILSDDLAEKYNSFIKGQEFYDSYGRLTVMLKENFAKPNWVSIMMNMDAFGNPKQK